MTLRGVLHDTSRMNLEPERIACAARIYVSCSSVISRSICGLSEQRRTASRKAHGGGRAVSQIYFGRNLVWKKAPQVITWVYDQG